MVDLPVPWNHQKLAGPDVNKPKGGFCGRSVWTALWCGYYPYWRACLLCCSGLLHRQPDFRPWNGRPHRDRQHIFSQLLPDILFPHQIIPCIHGCLHQIYYITELLRYYLNAFPEKLGKNFVIEKKDLLATAKTQAILLKLIDQHIRKFSSDTLISYLTLLWFWAYPHYQIPTNRQNSKEE